MSALEELIRTIPDYPKAGILFRDVTTLLGDAQGLKAAITQELEKAPQPDQNATAAPAKAAPAASETRGKSADKAAPAAGENAKGKNADKAAKPTAPASKTKQ